MASDPPRHRVLRRILGRSFGAKGVAALEERVHEIAVSLLNSAPVGEEFEFVSRVAALFPMMVLCAFMGISAERVADLARWASATTAVGEPRSREEFEDLLVELGRCYQFFGGEVAVRAGCPRDGLISSLLAAEDGGEPLNEMTLLMFCQFLTAAAGETTRHLLTGALIALAEHPGEYARLRADPAGLAEPATEELLRWVTPAIGFVRTAATDTMLSGRRILAGERVLMLYPAGNRDPAVWPDPERFELARQLSQPHLAFGIGEHLCLGAALARLEIRVFWEEFARRFARIELSGEPVRRRTTLFTAWDELRVVLHE
jgi:cytochrome P450